MGVYLREKKLKNGRLSLYIDYYPAIVNPATGKKTRREFLKLYLYAKPKGQAEKDHNKETRIIAETKRVKRETELQNEEYGIFNKDKKKKDFLAYFLELAEERKASTGNYDNWLSAYRYLKAFSGGKCKIGDLNQKFCMDFRTFLLNADKLNRPGHKLAHNSSVSYFNKFRAAIKRVFNERLLRENPLIGVPGIKGKNPKREFLTIEELQSLAKTDCELPKLKAAALFSALTGLRWSDIIERRWAEIQYSKDMGYFINLTQVKTDEPITHPISETAVKVLGDKGKPFDKIFDGLEYSAWTNLKLAQWIMKAGITKKITFHNFRHTYATIQLNAGTSIYVIKELLGHKDLRTTEIYVKQLNEGKKQAANVVNIDL